MNVVEAVPQRLRELRRGARLLLECRPRLVALGPAFAIALASEDGSFFTNINEYLNVLQSLQLPFAMLPVLYFSRNQRLMGRFRSSASAIAITNLLALAVMGINVKLVVDALDGAPPYAIAIAAIYALFYFGLCLSMVTGQNPQDTARDLVRWLRGGRGCLEGPRASITEISPAIVTGPEPLAPLRAAPPIAGPD